MVKHGLRLLRIAKHFFFENNRKSLKLPKAIEIRSWHYRLLLAPMNNASRFPNKVSLKVHRIENFFDSDFGICVISLIVMSKY